ncbi:MAG: cobalt transporter [Roseovarius sp.]|nr:cobalt transporter [Roseovarius sp.]|tara:strand:+ start:16647 stop:17318 length:672 start_codon:yes stop_codon:yes gene_type:complete
MHIEPGIVDSSKVLLSYATAAGAIGFATRQAIKDTKMAGIAPFLARVGLSAAIGLFSFQILPHFSAGVSEVHFIFGSTLFLLFGAAPAAFGLSIALLIQGLLFAPFDLPQYGMNLTTLMAPLFALSVGAKRVIAPDTAYVDISYKQALALSTAYQAGIVAWVAFWVFYGQGFTASTLSSVLTFGMAYMMVVLIEPLVDLAVLAGAKSLRDLTSSQLFNRRLLG